MYASSFIDARSSAVCATAARASIAAMLLAFSSAAAVSDSVLYSVILPFAIAKAFAMSSSLRPSLYASTLRVARSSAVCATAARASIEAILLALVLPASVSTSVLYLVMFPSAMLTALAMSVSVRPSLYASSFIDARSSAVCAVAAIASIAAMLLALSSASDSLYLKMADSAAALMLSISAKVQSILNALLISASSSSSLVISSACCKKLSTIVK